MSEFCFCSISLEQMDRMSSNFVHALILKRSSFGIVTCYFGEFITELWPLIDVRFSFPLNIFRNNRQNLTKLCICLVIDTI